MFEAAEEALDEVSIAIQERAEGKWAEAVRERLRSSSRGCVSLRKILQSAVHQPNTACTLSWAARTIASVVMSNLL